MSIEASVTVNDRSDEAVEVNFNRKKP